MSPFKSDQDPGGRCNRNPALAVADNLSAALQLPRAALAEHAGDATGVANRRAEPQGVRRHSARGIGGARTRRPPGRPSQSRSVIAATAATSGRDGHSLTVICTHTASGVFVMLKAGRPAQVARHERALPLIIDPCPDK
jgi:hypothetical protein